MLTETSVPDLTIVPTTAHLRISAARGIILRHYSRDIRVFSVGDINIITNINVYLKI